MAAFWDAAVFEVMSPDAKQEPGVFSPGSPSARTSDKLTVFRAVHRLRACQQSGMARGGTQRFPRSGIRSIADRRLGSRDPPRGGTGIRHAQALLPLLPHAATSMPRAIRSPSGGPASLQREAMARSRHAMNVGTSCQNLGATPEPHAWSELQPSAAHARPSIPQPQTLPAKISRLTI